MQFKAVGRVSVGHLGIQVGRQVDDMDGTERAFFRADTATNAEALGDEGDFGIRRDFDAELPGSNDRARLFAFLSAFLHRSVYSLLLSPHIVDAPWVCTAHLEWSVLALGNFKATRGKMNSHADLVAVDNGNSTQDNSLARVK